MNWNDNSLNQDWTEIFRKNIELDWTFNYLCTIRPDRNGSSKPDRTNIDRNMKSTSGQLFIFEKIYDLVCISFQYEADDQYEINVFATKKYVAYNFRWDYLIMEIVLLLRNSAKCTVIWNLNISNYYYYCHLKKKMSPGLVICTGIDLYFRNLSNARWFNFRYENLNDKSSSCLLAEKLNLFVIK